MSCTDIAFTVTLGAQSWRYAFAHGVLFLVQPGLRELLARCSSIAAAQTLAVRDASQRAVNTNGAPIIAMEK